MTQFSNHTALVTGANSGLGFEAAAQLAEAGYGKVILACRSLAKAEDARRALAERVGADPFETLAVDVSSLASAEAAAAELIARGDRVDSLLLNAGMVSGDEMQKNADGLELAFASSIVGHHILTVRLAEAGLLDGGRVVIAGSEAANGDLPSMFEMNLYDFATGAPREFGSDLKQAMLTFARGAGDVRFSGSRYYATTKVFSAWWAAGMARRFGDRISFFNVSPGSNMATNAARHVKGFKRFLFTKVMPLVGPLMGVDQPVSKGAGRYVEVLHGNGAFTNGATYTSRPGKLIGPMQKMTHAHLLDDVRQETAWGVLKELTGAPQAAAAPLARHAAVVSATA
jgi:NAD(P)-dependent dehydrogenase (short-subunit alcohol dehydrogenase family)